MVSTRSTAGTYSHQQSNIHYCDEVASVANFGARELSDRIEADILAGVFAVGNSLPSERELASTHGIGRPLVREVLSALATRGLVETLPGRGTFVRETAGFGALDQVRLSHQRRTTARQLVEARVVIETATARLAAANATPSHIKLMEAALTRMDTDVSVLESVRLDITFHLAIARASSNPILEGMLGSMATLAIQLMLRSISDGRTAEQSKGYHWVCWEAIRDGDAVAAAKAMEDHLLVAVHTYGKAYDEPLDLTANSGARSILREYGSLDALISAVLRPTPHPPTVPG